MLTTKAKPKQNPIILVPQVGKNYEPSFPPSLPDKVVPELKNGAGDIFKNVMINFLPQNCPSLSNHWLQIIPGLFEEGTDIWEKRA